MKPMIYVAGPISKGLMRDNIRSAIDVAESLIEIGFLPFVPQMSFFWDVISPKDVGESHIKKNGDLHYWMNYDRGIIEHCQALYRIPGESVGADMEVEWAKKLGIPVLYSIMEAEVYLLMKGNNG